MYTTGLTQNAEIIDCSLRQVALCPGGSVFASPLAMSGQTFMEPFCSAHLLCAIVPAQQAEIVDHGLREVPLRPELAHRCGAVPLGQLALVGRQDEGHVPKGGLLEAQRLVDEDLQRIRC